MGLYVMGHSGLVSYIAGQGQGVHRASAHPWATQHHPWSPAGDRLFVHMATRTMKNAGTSTRMGRNCVNSHTNDIFFNVREYS